MKRGMGIIAGKGSEGSGVGNDTCSTGQVFTIAVNRLEVIFALKCVGWLLNFGVGIRFSPRGLP